LLADGARTISIIVSPGRPRSTVGAVLSSDDFGSSVERTAKLHPLRARAQGWIGAKLEQARIIVQLGGLELSLMTGERTRGSVCALRRSFWRGPSAGALRCALGQGVVSKPPALNSRAVTLVLVEVAVADSCFLVHAVRRLVEVAERLGPPCGSWTGIVGAA
jgi:hypothetical protein